MSPESGDRAVGAKTDDPQVIYKKVKSGEIKGVYKSLDELQTSKDLSGITNNAQVMYSGFKLQGVVVKIVTTW